MDKIRVLLADDAAVIRRLVSTTIDDDRALQVVGTAANGLIALEKIKLLDPDIVVLDLEMPELDGLQTLKALRQSQPRLPVVMFSSYTRRGMQATVDALMLGASDYVPKPDSIDDVASCIRDELIPRIKSLARLKPASGILAAASVVGPPAIAEKPAAVEVLAIGASTGGPNALVTLLSALPASWSLPILVTQHMPPQFTQQLALRLSEQTSLVVSEAEHGMSLLGGRAYIAPGNHHLVLRGLPEKRLELNQDPPVNSCRPSVDVMFQSVAENVGPGVLAVVLTGMGQDGLRGCEHIRQRGGQVIVQDEASSVVWSMPGAVARAGLAQAVLPLEALAAEIIMRVQSAPKSRN
ncbi:MAG: chemotaxis response regulator protein-glutamate methylesterase [Gemmataceae bacterium]